MIIAMSGTLSWYPRDICSSFGLPSVARLLLFCVKSPYNDNKAVKLKRLTLLVVLAMLVVCLGVVNASCDQESKYVGMYYGVGSYEGSWLELKADGTFQSVLGWSGRWEVAGNQLTLIHAFGVDRYVIEDNKIMFQSGKLWFVKP